MRLFSLKNIPVAWDSYLLLSFALAILISLAVQYRLDTSFPLGGDAPAYIGNLKLILSGQAGLRAILGNTWYPAIYVILAPAYLLHFIAWPSRFIWWMVFGQIAVGLSLWRLVSHLGGKMSAALAVALWALTPIALTPFYEDGTLAQLWSLVWLILFIDGFARSRKASMVIFGVAALASHPITAIFLIASIVVFSILIPILGGTVTPIQRNTLSIVIFISAAMLAAGLIFNAGGTRASVLGLSFNPESSPYTKELVFGSFLPWTLVAIPGFFLLTGRPGRKSPFALLVAAFWIVSWLLATNDLMGVGFWTRRLAPYLVVFTICYAAYAFPRLIGHIVPHRYVQTVFIVVLIGIATIGRWHDNARIYQFYESPSRYLRASQEEVEAMYWLAKNIPAGSTILASNTNRHSEWVRALTPFSYAEVSEAQLNTRLQNQAFHDTEYVIMFTRREKAPLNLMQEHPEFVLYKNAGAVVIKTKPL